MQGECTEDRGAAAIICMSALREMLTESIHCISGVCVCLQGSAVSCGATESREEEALPLSESNKLSLQVSVY